MYLTNTFAFLSLFLSTPTSACTIVSDPSCTRVSNIMCDDVPPSTRCEVHLRRTFLEPGTYCVNITLEDSSSMALTSTTVTINKSQDAPGWLHRHTCKLAISWSKLDLCYIHFFIVCLFVFILVVSKKSYAREVVLSSTAVLVAVFAFVAYLACR